MKENKIFKKQNVMPVAILAAICVVIAALMGLVNMITAPVIEQAQSAAIAESLSTVMPGIDPEEVDIAGLDYTVPTTVTAIYRDKGGAGHVVTLVKQGYADKIALTVGIDTAGKITKAVITSQAETHGKSGIDDMVAAFSGTDSSSSQSVQHVSGATKTSDYIKSAVYDAFVALNYATPQDEDQSFDNGATEGYNTDTAAVAAIAKEMSGKDYTAITLDGAPSSLVGVYRSADGGHALHVATRTEWRPIEVEAIVTVNGFGTIEHIKVLQWVVGYDKDLLPAAPECSEEFLNSFIGKSAHELARVELVTHATNTSNNLTDALTESLMLLYPVPVYRIIAVSAVALLALAAVAYAVYIKVRRREN